MRLGFLPLLALLAVPELSACRDLDGFLFSGKPAKSYALPQNDIPQALIEALTIPSGSASLAGYFVKAAESPETAASVLYSHGNDGNIDDFWDRVKLLHGVGLNVLIYDYRGYGASTGDSTGEDTLHADGEAAIAALQARVPEPGRIVIYGFSLGNVPSLHVAAQAAARGESVRAVVAEAPFASGEALIQGSTALPIPGDWLARGKYDNVANVRVIKAPLLLLGGTADDTARFEEHGRVVFGAAAEPKTLVLVPGGSHRHLPDDMGLTVYQQTVAAFVKASARDALLDGR